MTSDTSEWGQTVDVDGISVQGDGLPDVATPAEPELDTRFTKLVGFWAPLRWVTPEEMDVDGLVEEIEETVRTRGLVAYDGQVITSLHCVHDWDAWFDPGRRLAR
jgi:hypothetical protein